MNFHKLIPAIVICLASTNLLAQTESKPVEKKHPFTFYAGAGPNVYFNNLVLAKDYVNEFNYSFAGRIMWEPEHNLSLGIESGYYRLYTVDFDTLSDVHISNASIPIQLVISMKFLKKFYFSFSSGQSVLLNDVTQSADGDISASTISLGDFSGSLGYRFSKKNRFSMGVESKLYWSSKLNDKSFALLFMVGYSL